MDERTLRDSARMGSAGSSRFRWRVLTFVALCVVCFTGAGAYAVLTVWRLRAAMPPMASIPIVRLDHVPSVLPPAAVRPAPPAARPSYRDRTRASTTPVSRPAGTGAVAGDPLARSPAAEAPIRTTRALEPADPEPPRPYVLFRSTALGETYGRVSLAYLDALGDPRQVTPLRCDRVHFAAGRGLCLEAKRGLYTTFRAHIFDRDFRILHTVPLSGIPSRARLSPDGRRAAMTVFVTGHSYASSDFSTRTSVVDAGSGKVLVEDLEDFVVLRDGTPFKSTDFNFWGVTFARDGNRFYATLGSGGQFFLIEGDLAARRARVIHEGVECPSLSPDSTRVTFKRRTGTGDRFGRFAWRLHVLDLATRAETPLLGETRSVDDQVEWLDNEYVVYALPDDVPHASAATNSWALARDGSGGPRLLLPLAFSPAVVR